MRHFVLPVIIFFLYSCSSTTTIYIVRHAEKQEQDPNNPVPPNDVELSEAGHARAHILADSMAGKPLNAVFATTIKRTQQTVGPTALAKGLNVRQYTASQPASDALVDSLVLIKGKKFLVAGHSNTVPAMVRHLGLTCSFTGNIPDSDYDNLFIITVKKGIKSVQEKVYGPPSP